MDAEDAPTGARFFAGVPRAADGLSDPCHPDWSDEEFRRSPVFLQWEMDVLAYPAQLATYERAQAAWGKGLFDDEIVAVTVQGKKGDTTVAQDEGYNKLKLEKVPTLKPAFDRSGSGTVTAANSSSFNDGASAVVLTNAELARQYGKGSRVLARVVATADAALDPIDFPVAPAKVVPLVLERAGLKMEDIKVWEFNEAFAAVVRANAKVR